MIATAIFLVQLAGDTAPSKMWRYHWMTESADHAIVELADWQKNEQSKVEQEEGWKLTLKEWGVQERSDIGY